GRGARRPGPDWDRTDQRRLRGRTALRDRAVARLLDRLRLEPHPLAARGRDPGIREVLEGHGRRDRSRDLPVRRALHDRLRPDERVRVEREHAALPAGVQLPRRHPALRRADRGPERRHQLDHRGPAGDDLRRGSRARGWSNRVARRTALPALAARHEEALAALAPLLDRLAAPDGGLGRHLLEQALELVVAYAVS